MTESPQHKLLNRVVIGLLPKAVVAAAHKASISNVDLRGTNLAHADLTYTVLSGVSLEGAVL
jgi:uncharacterized protein YjbI with pentapeptide repeats